MLDLQNGNTAAVEIANSVHVIDFKETYNMINDLTDIMILKSSD